MTVQDCLYLPDNICMPVPSRVDKGSSIAFLACYKQRTRDRVVSQRALVRQRRIFTGYSAQSLLLADLPKRKLPSVAVCAV